MASFRFAFVLCALLAVTSAADLSTTERTARHIAHCLPCSRGKVCAGTLYKKKCVKPMGHGKRCGTDPFWVCKKSLRCIKNRCRRRVARCPRCSRGKVCAGTLYKKECVKPMGLGKRCGTDPFWVCKKSLRCVRHKCRFTLGYLW
eukprot:IDg3058t1